MYTLKISEYEKQLIITGLEYLINELTITKSDNKEIQNKQDIIIQDTEKLLNEIKEKIKS